MRANEEPARGERSGSLLAEVPDLGRVYDCGDCGGIHVKIGAVSITLSPEAYVQFVAMVNTSAANFELWLQGRAVPVNHIEEEDAVGDNTGSL